MALSSEEQRKFAIADLFKSLGWKIYEEQLQSLHEVEESALLKCMQKRLTNEDLQELNFHLAKKQAFEAAKSIKIEMLEELEQSETSPAEGVKTEE